MYYNRPSSNRRSSLTGADVVRTSTARSPYGQGQHLATASATGMNANTSLSNNSVDIDIDPMFKDIIFSEDLEQKKLINRLYIDQYFNDSIAGSIVDIKCTLMFSDFTLGSIADSRIGDVFQENVERLNIRTLMQEICHDYNVKGAFVGSLLYNASRSMFVDIMPHGFENTRVDPLMFFGQDPIITVALPQYLRDTMNSDSPRVKELREYLGTDVMNQIASPSLELDSKSTVYVPRRAGPNSTAVSWLRRVLPWWLLEKNLYRGTLINSARRQKSILHVMLDGAGEWEPKMSDMDDITAMIQNADADPLGAVIATRAGVNISEIRDPTGGWTIFDSKDAMDSYKMKAMGISDALLSGDSTFSNQDSATSFWMDSIRSERDYITRRVLYNKIFPMISASNGYVVTGRGRVTTRGNVLDQIDPLGNCGRLQDGTRLLIPSVHWEKSLKPEGDQAYMDMLQAMTDKGIPVPIRAIAAAGGFNLDSLLASQDNDIFLLERIGAYTKRVNDIKKQYGLNAADPNAAYASSKRVPRNVVEHLANMQNEIRALASSNYVGNLNTTRSDVLARGNGKIVGLANRDYGESAEVFSRDAVGNKHYMHNQKQGNENANRKIVAMLRNSIKRGVYNTRTTTTSYSE